jgi:formate-dependent phosphoribosylglycinamide formyltransferase (GAR transformylase)
MNRNELRRAAQEKLQMNITEYYNFAFCGGTNAG